MSKKLTPNQRLRALIREFLALAEPEHQLYHTMRGIRYVVRLTQAEYDALSAVAEEKP